MVCLGPFRTYTNANLLTYPKFVIRTENKSNKWVRLFLLSEMKQTDDESEEFSFI